MEKKSKKARKNFVVTVVFETWFYIVQAGTHSTAKDDRDLPVPLLPCPGMLEVEG